MLLEHGTKPPGKQKAPRGRLPQGARLLAHSHPIDRVSNHGHVPKRLLRVSRVVRHEVVREHLVHLGDLARDSLRFSSPLGLFSTSGPTCNAKGRIESTDV